MPASWPATLPAPADDFKGEYTSGLVDPDERISPERSRRLPDATRDVSWVFTATQMAAFKTFFDTTTNGGGEWFSATWLATVHPDALFARFSGDPPYESRPRGLHWLVTASLEVIR